MAKILGLDLGTNSVGWSIRNTIPTSEFKNQVEKFGVIIFKKGVGEGKSGEFSFAAERTKKRSSRRLYQARKYRIWKTLEILIEYDYCPLSKEGLNRWRKYDKAKALKGDGGRAYPIEDKQFDAWVKLDFDEDGKPDYISPYQLRAELVEKKLDLEQSINRYKTGRALYHIAQRRGFKSSRKDAVADDAGDRQDAKSEQKKESEFENSLQKKFNMSLSDFPTMGAALAFIEKQGERVRLEWIQHTFRKHYKEECGNIFEFQGLGVDHDLFKKLIENAKNRYNGSIFFQRPLRSQKGLVGTCTLEKGKSRCPVSHPEFEEFRALSFINNIQYKVNGNWENLPMNLRSELYQKLFFRPSKPHFNFIEIREFLEKHLDKNLSYRDDKERGIEKSINYSDKTNVSACPVSARLKDILGEQWKSFKKETALVRKNKDGQEHQITYSIDDVWHILFSFNDEEIVAEFACEKLELDEAKIKKLLTSWKAIPEGYAMLSLHAIKKVNEFLREGFIYPEAVLLANIPTIIGNEIWRNIENQRLIKESISKLIDENRQIKMILGIVNGLTAKYKSLYEEEKYGYKDKTYTLTEKDLEEIKATIIEAYGERTWNQKIENKTVIIDTVTNLFQSIFRNGFDTKLFGEERYHIVTLKNQIYYKAVSHQFYKLPRVVDTVIDFIRGHFTHVSEEKLAKLYHPSMIEFYSPSPRAEDGRFYLQSPKIGAFKNPMAMRTLHELRKLINYLLKTGQIDEETRIVVETARELNDANKRWAIEAFQRQRQVENNEYVDALRSILEQEEYEAPPNPESSDDIDKIRLWYEQVKLNNIGKGKGDYAQNKWTNQTSDLFQSLAQAKTLQEKYRLWKEQNCICMYTGRIISITDLFDTNRVDFEHTIPRSISFDSSLANLTVCFAKYNRYVKKNQIPTQLPNYEKDVTIDGEIYQAIKPRLKDWEDKITHLKAMIEFWKGKSKNASTKDYKDDAIRQRHLWQMELDYWQNKLERFTMNEVKSGFKNSQLVDTQLISKYALHYLKSAFNTVEVQKGIITAEFRKILGIQATYEKKSRAKHSHHAIDATVLTMIPYPAKREQILKLHYQAEEEKKLNQWDNLKFTKVKIESEIKRLELPDVNDIIDDIDNQILINNISRDQALTPGKKVVRRRGKIVYLRDKKGNIIRDSEGKPKPKMAQGDCIRGQLHKETFFGAIKDPLRDSINGKPIITEGKFSIEKMSNGSDKITMVTRSLIKDFTSEKDIESIIDPWVKYSIQKTIKERLLLNLTFKEAISQSIWLLDKNGEPKTKDKNGRLISPIRHVRCKVAAGRGYMTKEKSLMLKKQTYLSAHDYKHFYYAQNSDNYLYLLYEILTEKGLKRTFKIVNYLEVAQLGISNLKELLNVPDYTFHEKIINKAHVIFKLKAILKTGTKILVKANEEEVLSGYSLSELSRRLYKLYKFNEMNGTGYLYIQFHMEGRPDKELGDGDTVIDVNQYQPRLKLSSDNFNCLVEGYDFDIAQDGKIKFRH